MEHPSILESELVRQAASVGVMLDAYQSAALIDFLGWLIASNRLINLTAITDEHEAVRLHLVDSLTAVREVLAAPPGPLLDLGTGGGLPGVPLVIQTARSGVLLDSVAKKVRILNEYTNSRDLPIKTMGKRAEEYALEARGEFAVVVARAVTSLPSLVELAAPLLVEGGVLVCMKGTPTNSEVAAGARAARLCGMEPIGARTEVLPEGGEFRTIVSYSRVGRPQLTLPRRIGLAQSKPLA